MTPDIGAYMYEQLGRLAPVVEVPFAYHHVMLDQPIPLVTGLRTLLADWEHSVPHRRGDATFGALAVLGTVTRTETRIVRPVRGRVGSGRISVRRRAAASAAAATIPTNANAATDQ